MKTLDQLTVDHTAFPRFYDLLDAGGGYCPSLRVSVPEKLTLANAYDHAQALRFDNRRALRYQ